VDTTTSSDGNHPQPESDDSPTPLILFPGLGCDDRVFANQRAAFPEMIVPKWIEPKPREPLSDYAARMAEIIDPGRPCFLGGLSFGGVMALEVATHLMCRECYQFASIRGLDQLPPRLKMFHYTSDMVMLVKWFSPVIMATGGGWLRPIVRHTLQQIKDTDPRFMRWAARAILHWQPSEATRKVRLVQIHGDGDWVFPSQLIAADLMIPGARHLVSITHADEVNEYVRKRMESAPKWTSDT